MGWMNTFEFKAVQFGDVFGGTRLQLLGPGSSGDGVEWSGVAEGVAQKTCTAFASEVLSRIVFGERKVGHVVGVGTGVVVKVKERGGGGGVVVVESEECGWGVVPV